MKNGQNATATVKSLKDRIVEMLEKFGPDLTFAQARQYSAGKIKTTEQAHFEKVKREYLAEKNPAKPKEKSAPKVGAGKEAVVALLDERGHDLSYADAYPLLKAKGIEMGAEWYRRLVHEYRDQRGIPRAMAGGVRGGTPAEAETAEASAEPKPENRTNTVLDANNRLAEHEEELARNGTTPALPEPPPSRPVFPPTKQEETPAPAITPIADAIAVAQDLIARVGKDDAIKMIERL